MGETKTMSTLGELRPVDLRTVWPKEALAFTPWLAQPENIARLGTAIGMELEVENTEVAAGPFSADIVARETAGGAYVVIENQLEKTDHDHLGKAITYAAAFGAKTIVWIASNFTEEHRKALDWLNDNSVEDLSFFGVHAELWQIDNSKPALRFNVVSRPVESVRLANAQKASSDLSEGRQLQLAWWGAFRDALAATKAFPSVQAPRPRYWYNISLGRTGCYLSNTASISEPKIAVRLYLTGRHAGAVALQTLLKDRSVIEQELGHGLEWDTNPQADDKTIALTRPADLWEKDKWDEYRKWMVESAIRFKQVFGPRILAMNLEAVPDAPVV